MDWTGLIKDQHFKLSVSCKVCLVPEEKPFQTLIWWT